MKIPDGVAKNKPTNEPESKGHALYVTNFGDNRRTGRDQFHPLRTYRRALERIAARPVP